LRRKVQGTTFFIRQRKSAIRRSLARIALWAGRFIAGKCCGQKRANRFSIAHTTKTPDNKKFCEHFLRKIKNEREKFRPFDS
jgi:hypothetical protein